MANKPDNPAEPFKKALTEATRAMANDAEISVSYSLDPPGITNDTMLPADKTVKASRMPYIFVSFNARKPKYPPSK